MKLSYRIKDLTGKRFERLVVLKYTLKRKRGSVVWKCLCDCGEIAYIASIHLIHGFTKSCGCLWLEVVRKNIEKYHTTHGKSNSRIYRIYKGMVNRCYNQNGTDYFLYGGRGIKVCERWLGKDGFIHFYEDKGFEYEQRIASGEKISLDRYPDNDGNYSPENTRWATDQDQVENTRVFGKAKDKKAHLLWKDKISNAMRKLLSGKLKSSKYSVYFGCSVEELRKHLASQFKDGMTCDNYGKYTKKIPNVWNIDHIIPCYKFDLVIEQARYDCFNYKNLRPMWAIDNFHNKLR